MRKVILYIIAFSSLICYILACNSRFMNYFVNDFNNEGRPRLLHFDKNKYGDLYGLSYLKKYKLLHEQPYFESDTFDNRNKNISLWCMGDSYLGSSFYLSEKPVNYLYKSEMKNFYWMEQMEVPKKISLDTNRINVLLIETTERSIRRRFANTKPLNSYYYIENNFKTFPATDKISPSKSAIKILKEQISYLLEWRLIPSVINQNLETMLYGYELFSPLKETRAAINYNLLERTLSPSVVVSEDKSRLFYNSTIDTLNYQSSSFHPVHDNQIVDIVDTLNAIVAHYKNAGFQEVIVSFIPNPVTIVGGSGLTLPHNEIIPRIQNHPSLKATYIDIYAVYKKHPAPGTLYCINDTHWTKLGFTLWVEELNKSLLQISFMD